MSTIDVKDAGGVTVAIEKPLAPNRAAASASRPTVMSNEDFAAIGAVNETAPATDTASSGLNGRFQRACQRLTSIIALLPAALGAGGGLKVDGSGTALPVSATSLPLMTGAATETTLGTLLTTTDFDAKVGSLTETAPATDTASSGLNGRFQRACQRLTSIIALLPSSLSGGSFKIIPHDGTNAAGIKAASTAPDGTEPALVVTISPNSVNSNGAKAATNSAPVVAATDQQTISVAPDTSKIANGATGTNLTPKFAKIVASSSGVNIVVAAVTSKKIRVLALSISVNAAVNVKWQSHTTPTDLTGLLYCAAQGDGEVLPFNQSGWFESLSGESLDVNLSGAVAVGGHLTYIEV